MQCEIKSTFIIKSVDTHSPQCYIMSVKEIHATKKHKGGVE